MTTSTSRVIRLRYAGVCRECGTALPSGTEAHWDAETKTVSCAVCPDRPDFSPAALAVGEAGRSANAEAERRNAARERRIRERFPRIGGLILVLTEPPQTTQSWSQGAVGERRVAERLAKSVEAGTIIVLHDRRIPGSKANIDHIAIGPSGIFVVDTKRYVEKRVESRSDGWIFGTEPPRLFVGGRDQTKLVSAMAHQVAAVHTEIDRMGGVVPISVHPVLCFVDGDWELFSGPFDVGGVYVTHPRALVERVTRPGPLDQDDRLAIAHHLAARLPQA